MGAFQKQAIGNVIDKKSPAYAVRQYNYARTNLLTALILTVVNILLGVLDADVYLLFSVSFPYFMFDVTDIVRSIPSMIVLVLYFVYYLCSKKKPGFMIAAMVTFIFDFIFLIGYSLILTTIPDLEITLYDFIIDYLTHVWVLVCLISGTRFTNRYRAAIREDATLVSGSVFRNAAIPMIKMPEESAAFTDEASREEAPSEYTEN